MAKTNFKKNGNGKKPSAPKMPGEWLYLNKEELPLRKIYELFKEDQTAEYWEAAGVLEISLPESGTLDMEDLEGTLGDDEKAMPICFRMAFIPYLQLQFVQRIMKKQKRLCFL